MDLGARDFLEGAAFALTTLAGCGFAGWVLVLRRLPWLQGVVHALAVFLAVTGLLVAVHLLPGALGVLSRWSVLALALVAAAAAWFVPARADGADVPRSAEPEPPDRLALLGVTIALTGALAFVIARSVQTLDSVDALTTHLPGVARWIQEGSYWQLVQYAPDLSNATYPHNGTLMLLAAVLPWEHVFLVRYVDIPFLLAAAAGLYAIARELGARQAAALLAAAAFTTLAAVNEPALRQAQVDAPMLAWFAIGSLFLLRTARRPQTAEIVLAGAGLGLAFGTKWYAVVYVPLLALAWMIARRGAVRDCALLIATVAGSGGFWLVRNWVETGNPVHPAKVAPGGVTIFDAPPDPLRERAGFTVSDYLLDGDVWREDLLPAWWQNFGLLGPLLMLAALAGLVAAWRRRERRPLTVAVLALVMAALYTKLPDTAFGPPGDPVLVGANARYLVPALMAGAVLAAWLGGRVVCLLLLAGIVDGVARSYDEASARDVVLAIVLLAAAGGVAWALRRRPLNPVVAAAAAVLVLLGAGWSIRERDAVEPFAARDPVAAWLHEHAPSGRSIAVAKTWNPGGISPVTPAFGPRLDNRVDFLGRFVDGTLRAWTEEPGFTDQVRRRDYDVVVVGTGIPPEPGGEQPEAGWLRALGYRERVRTPRLVLFAR